MRCDNRANSILKAFGREPAPWEVLESGSGSLAAEAIAYGDQIAVGLLRKHCQQISSMVETVLGMWIELDNLNNGDGSADGEDRQSQINKIYEMLSER